MNGIVKVKNQQEFIEASRGSVYRRAHRVFCLKCAVEAELVHDDEYIPSDLVCPALFTCALCLKTITEANTDEAIMEHFAEVML